jgi:hypothetical protein
MWADGWEWIKEKDTRIKSAFDAYYWLIKAFEIYLRGYRHNLNDCYPGINALTMGEILIHLADMHDDKTSPDPEILWVRNMADELKGSLLFSLEAIAREDNPDYWSLTSLADLMVLIAKVPQEVTRAYRKALTASRRNESYLKSSLGQLELLLSLDMRVEFVQAGIDAINEELRRMRKEKADEVHERGKVEKIKHRDGYVFLFTGYMIDHLKKSHSYFPPERENDFRKAIELVLKKHNAGPDDLAITTGMDAGSELIFVECCTERGIPVQAYFPSAEAPYVRDFVSPGGDQWVERFYQMRNHPLVDEFYQPDQVGLPKEGDDVHERNNRWALYSALVRGVDKVRLIALWDGKNDTAKDLDAHLVKHMVDLMRDTGGIVEHINPFKLTGILEEMSAQEMFAQDEPSKPNPPPKKKTARKSKPKASKKKA